MSGVAPCTNGTLGTRETLGSNSLIHSCGSPCLWKILALCCSSAGEAPCLLPSDWQWFSLSVWHLHGWTGLTDTTPQAWYTVATKSVHEYRDGNTGHKLGTSPSQSHSVTRRENSTVITYLESEVTAVAGNGLGLYQCRKASCLLL